MAMGGLAAIAAAQDQPDGYRALALVGSSTSFDGAPPPTGLNNLLLVWGRWDEFGQLMWQARPHEIGASPRLQALFGSNGPVQTGETYGAIETGQARRLTMPAVTHPGEHFSNDAVADVIAWFEAAAEAPAAAARDNQIWIWREIGALIAFCGFIALLLGLFNLLAPLFKGLVAPAEPARARRGAKWWLWFAAAALIPALVYLPAMLGGFVLTQPAPWAPQAITNHILIWALASAAIGWALGLFDRTPRTDQPKWIGSTAAAIGAAALAFGAFELLQTFVPTNFGVWIVSLNRMTPWAEASFGLYILPFAAFFLLTFSGLHHRLAIAGDSALAMYATAIAALAGGVALLCVILYAPLFATGLLAVPVASLQAIIALQFVPILAVCAVIATYAYRRTNSYVGGALLCALFVTWYVTAGTATMLPPLGGG